MLGRLLPRYASQSAVLDTLIQAWRDHHWWLDVILVGGNHDRTRARRRPTWASSPWTNLLALGPFACCHHSARRI
ncbi:MAG: hypothetical protein R2838_21950 [Caldilineaceae bacterium]